MYHAMYHNKIHNNATQWWSMTLSFVSAFSEVQLQHLTMKTYLPTCIRRIIYTKQRELILNPYFSS